MAANRGEIATRIMRAGTELGCNTVGIYSNEGMCLLIVVFVGWLVGWLKFHILCSTASTILSISTH